MHDRREGGFDYYWNQVVVPSVAACIERGIFSKEEWDLLLGNFHYIKSLRYSTTFVSNNLPYVNNESGDVTRPNLNTFKFYVLCIKALRAFAAGGEIPEVVLSLKYGGTPLENLTANDRCEIMQLADKYLLQAGTELQAVKDCFCLIPNDKENSPKIIFRLETVGGETHLVVEIAEGKEVALEE